VVGDIIGSKLVTFQVLGVPLTLTVGMIPFPLTFLLTDVLNEFYGKGATRFVTLVGLAMALFSYAVIYISIAIPISPLTQAPDWKGVTDSAFNNVFGGSQRMLMASLVAYIIGQLVDISVFHALKQATGHRYLWLRSTGSTVVSQLVDTLAIQTVAWWGLLPVGKVIPIALTSYGVKLFVAISLTPFIYAMHAIVLRWLKLSPLTLSAQPDTTPV
jgi:uncharacterized integral membrane protein (TIGR00697 family)